MREDSRRARSRTAAPWPTWTKRPNAITRRPPRTTKRCGRTWRSGPLPRCPAREARKTSTPASRAVEERQSEYAEAAANREAATPAKERSCPVNGSPRS